MLFAGHETAAQSLAATLGFLAVHDEIQEEIYQEIKSVLSDHPDPRFEDHTKLEKVLAVFYEALRMFPPGHVLIREAAKDTVINVPKPVGQEGTIPIPIPKGFQVLVDMNTILGTLMNPKSTSRRGGMASLTNRTRSLPLASVLELASGGGSLRLKLCAS
ncbi:cytochrome P450 [Armillaria nabsnona]|nr:cytochrome P450 [Armillaria nabsnona]